MQQPQLDPDPQDVPPKVAVRGLESSFIRPSDQCSVSHDSYPSMVLQHDRFRYIAVDWTKALDSGLRHAHFLHF